MTRSYYTLVTRAPNDDSWTIEFGDYSRKVVADELRDMKESYNWVRKTQTKIIKTGDAQADINAAVAKLDLEHRLSIVNSHRKALGYELLATATPEEITDYMTLIEKHAPHGNDPFA